MVSVAHWVGVAALSLLSWQATAQDGAPPDRSPEAGRVQTRQFKVRSLDKDGDSARPWIRYQFVMPLEEQARPDLVVLCHGTGLDHRWGLANHPTAPPARFRPDDVVVSIDGPTIADDGTRLFLGRDQDATAFAACLSELKEQFHPGRVFLYGHSQGSFFVTYFAGARPGLVDGVVAHASGIWTWTDTDALAKARTPVILMHGTADPMVPYPQSVGGRDQLLKLAHPAAALRRLPGYNHWPNAVRASECIDWLEGMSTSDAAEAISRAERLMQTKPADQYQYRCAPPLGLAWQVVERLRGRGPRDLENVPEATRAQADELARRIEVLATSHVTALAKHLDRPDGLTLDNGAPWLGHLLAAREDLRGIPAFEKYAARIKLEDAAAAHRKAADVLMRVWFDGRNSVRDKFTAALRDLPGCFLDERLPSELAATLEQWYNDAENQDLRPEDLLAYPSVTKYRAGLKDGLTAYERIWSADAP